MPCDSEGGNRLIVPEIACQSRLERVWDSAGAFNIPKISHCGENFCPAGLPGRGFFAEKFRRVLKMDFFTRAQSAKKRSQGEELSGMDNGGTLETA